MSDQDNMRKLDKRAWWVLAIVVGLAFFVVADFFGYAELIWK